MSEFSELFICQNCVGDGYLKNLFHSEDENNECSYCEMSNIVLPLSIIAEQIRETIEGHFELTPTEPSGFEYALINDKDISYDWERAGQEVSILIQEIAEVQVNISNDILSYLSFYYGGDPRDFEESPWDADACYAERSPDTHHYKESWNYFCEEITQKSRFFNRTAEKILDNIFKDIASMSNYSGDSVIRKAGPNTNILYVYRARVTQSDELLDRILRNPIRELSAPPVNSAKPGRMNASGISVFYGAADIDTCVSEVRPPVGSNVIVGKFKILENLYLLDLNVLSQVYVNGSYFDPNYANRKSHASFLKHLVTELTKPVMPEKEIFDYLPTQVISEYLSQKTHPVIDGIIFNSTQSSSESQNIILFQKSCSVKPYILPANTSISVNYGWCTDDDSDDSITVYEEVFDNKGQIQTSELINEDDISNNLIKDSIYTLSLNLKNDISVFQIQGVRYDTSSRFVSRHRFDQTEIISTPSNTIDTDELF